MDAQSPPLDKPFKDAHVRRLERLVERARRLWIGDLGSPEVVVLSSMEDDRVPAAARRADARQRSSGARGMARAFVHGQKIYLVAAALPSPKEAAEALAHETIAHWGLRRLWGAQLDDILETIARRNSQAVANKAKEYGLDLRDVHQRREAAEEVLADIAAEDRDPSMAEILEARSRALARQLFPDLADIPFSRAELLVNFIAPVRLRMRGQISTDPEPRFVRDGLANHIPRTSGAAWSPPPADASRSQWRSRLIEAAKSAPMRSAPAAQWSQWLSGLPGKGVKQEEIAWSGLADWLAGRAPARVRREEVVGFLQIHSTRVEETHLEDIALEARLVTADNASAVAQSLGRPADHLDFDGISQPYAIFCSGQACALTYARDEASAIAAALSLQDHRQASKGGTQDALGRRANYAAFTLPGGQAYREILLRLPTPTQPGLPVYRSRHWSHPNVVAHLRLNDRVDAHGRRILFAEELQSDLAADALRFGWSDQPSSPGGPVRPKAPFVSGARSWVALAIKTIVREAVIGGYDAVAFINAEQVLQRFDLSRHIDGLSWTTVIRDGEPARLIWLHGPAGHRNYIVARAENGTIFDGDKTMRGDDLETVVGPRWAQTILRYRDGDDTQLDLSIGGEGLANFYDRVLPNMLRKTLRELDPQAASSTSRPIDFGVEEWALVEPSVDGGEPAVRHRNFPSRAAALAHARAIGAQLPRGTRGSNLELRSIGGPGNACLGFEVTPGLVQAVRQGLTLFSRTRGLDASGQFRQWFDGSRIVDRDGKPLVVYHGTNRDFSVFESRLPKTVYYVNGQEVTRADSWDMGPDCGGCPEGYHYLALLDSATFGPEEALAFRAREAAGSDHPDTRRLLADLGRLQGKRVEMRTEDRPTGDGFYFTPDTNYSFIRDTGRAEGGLVMPVYLSIKNPVLLSASAIEDAGRSFAMRKYMEQGHDGAIYAEDPTDLERRGYFSPTQIVAFHPHQVKSALGNAGTYDRTSADIRFSRAATADPERALAELRAIGLGADPLDVQVMHDDELRYALARLDHARRRAPMTDPKRATLSEIATRLDVATDTEGLIDLQQYLADRHGLEVADDGLIEAERLSQDIAALIGKLPIAMYHHTATSLLPSIAQDGLVVGRQTNFFNTQAGVYLSTIRAGQPVSVYSARAARVHGGEPCTLRVRRRLFEVTPDPDDADLAWARGRQFVTPAVPAGDVLWDTHQPDAPKVEDGDEDAGSPAYAGLRQRRAG